MSALPPGSTLGILGGGQLGRMLAQSAASLGYRVHIFTPEENAPASQVSPHTTRAELTDEAALSAFGKACDVVTYEFENIPVSAALAVERAGTPVWPSPANLRLCQHRLREKSALVGFGIPVARFAAIERAEDIAPAAAQVGLPAILKTAESGYDGKGQARVTDLAALEAAFARFGHVACILEAIVDFTMELSVIVARDAQRRAACFDAVQNIHRNHILHETLAPAPIPAAVAREAEMLALRIAEGMDLRGLMAVEMFLTPSGQLLVNELAPRPHNSGHWTMEACEHSQFAQAARAVLGLPLGASTRHSNARMLNLIGTEANEWATYLTDPRAHLHIYGKTDPRPGRKMGHVTWLSPRAEA